MINSKVSQPESPPALPTDRPVAITDLVPELGDDEKPNWLPSSSLKATSLALWWQTAIPTGEPVYTGDPDFVHPKVEMLPIPDAAPATK